MDYPGRSVQSSIGAIDNARTRVAADSPLFAGFFAPPLSAIIAVCPLFFA
jgi:hypothetical protein